LLPSPGRPLDAATRELMEPRFGRSFSRVRVHDDARAAESARSLGARAYALGANIVFGAGEHAPATPAGRWLLAHELTHVVQQSGAAPASVPEGPGGAEIRQATAAPRIQRACRTAIPDRTDECIGRSGTVADPFFRFRVGCDDFLNQDERDRFDLLLSGVVAGDVFRVRGFASEEGDFDVNHRLSCARALVAAAALGARGAIISERIAHGPQPGTAADHRSVVVERVAVPGRQSSRACGGRLVVDVATFLFPGNSRNPFDDLAFANRVYADCCVEFRSVGGGTVVGSLLGPDATLQQSGNCTNLSTEEQALVAHAESTVGSRAKIWVFYVPNFEPQSDAKGLSCPVSDVAGIKATLPSIVLVAGDADAATLAHELGHVLIDTGDHHGIVDPHDPGNVMVAPRELGGDIHITADALQCALVRSNVGRLR